VEGGRCLVARLILDFVKHLAYRALQGRKVSLDNAPDQLEIHPQILVSQNIPGPGNLRPGYVWVTCGKVIRSDVPDHLADDLQVSDDGVLCLRVEKEGVSPARNVSFDPQEAVSQVPEVDCHFFLQSLTTSRTTRSLRYGLIARSVRTSAGRPSAAETAC